jgi:hypothetical protein
MIASGEVDHLVVRPGQVGDTVFAPRDRAADAEVAATARRDPS